MLMTQFEIIWDEVGMRSDTGCAAQQNQCPIQQERPNNSVVTHGEQNTSLLPALRVFGANHKFVFSTIVVTV